MNEAHLQQGYGVRFDWGLAGARSVGLGSTLTVVVDVLSFTTTVSVALDLGTVVLPWPYAKSGAADFASELDAVLAVGRGGASPGQFSLSPASLRQGAAPARLVLPSPNGATVAHALGGACFAGSLRNADAMAAWIAGNHEPATTSVAIVAAGERWPDGSLRPAVEDLWGAGAIVAALRDQGWADLSPEAEAAAACWDSVAADVGARLFNCASGRELVDAGWRDDVLIAGEVNASGSVPLLRNGSFEPAN